MNVIGLLCLWMVMLAVSIPLGLISIASIGAVWFADPEEQNLMQQTETNDPITFHRITFHRITGWFGPFSITTNVRPWAGCCLIMGLLLTWAGMIGLLHFPTQVSPMQIDELLPTPGNR